LQAFDYVRVSSAEEAVTLLAEHNGGARILSGGTDLLVALREGRVQAEVVVDVKAIPELSAMHFDAESGLTLGAAVSCRRIYSDPALAAAYPGLMDAAHLIGGVQIQGRASMGGNLCNASPAADSIPALIVHRADCSVVGPGGRRTVPVEEFCTAPGKTVLRDGEFLASLQLPAPRPGFGAAYLRFIPRNEMDIAVVGVGAAVQLDAAGSRFEAVHVALGAVAPRPLYVPAIDEALRGLPITLEALEQAADLARAAARPITDMRGTADYRKHLTGVLTRRALSRAVERARGG
jgi:carbon-monoxide dehydrogenase medium subunit